MGSSGHGGSFSSSNKKLIAYVLPAMALAYLVAFPHGPVALAWLPYCALTTKGVDLSFISGAFLSAIWIIYTLLLLFPCYWVMGRYFALLVYLPINGVVFYKEPHEYASWLFLSIQTAFWDTPLLFWIYLMEAIGQRALEPFYSEITESLSVGSLPLKSDVGFLASRGVNVVVNMCREYAGPVREYAALGIHHIHLPTPDICEPSFEAVLKGLAEVEALRRSSKTLKIFVHCKAGRGRSATYALCTLLCSGQKVADAMVLLRSKRPVVEPYVAEFRVVRRLVEELERCDGDARRLLVGSAKEGTTFTSM